METHKLEGNALNLSEFIDMLVEHEPYKVHTVVVNPSDMHYFLRAIHKYHAELGWPSLTHLRVVDDWSVEFVALPCSLIRIIPSNQEPKEELTVPERMRVINFKGVHTNRASMNGGDLY